MAISAQLDAIEHAFLVIHAQKLFLRKVQSDVNNIVGYTTDALTVTNADKPYQYLEQTIAALEREERRLYYKMTRYN